MIRLGLVGAGFGRMVLLPAFLADQRFSVCRVCSLSYSKAVELATLAGLTPAQASTNWEALASDPCLDALAIAVPPCVQPAVIEAALRFGKHVFCEKPLGCGPYFPLRPSCGQALLVDFEFMEHKAFRRLKEVMDSGELGRALHASAIWHTETWAVAKGLRGWKTNVELGGGALGNFGPHMLHYIEEFLPPAREVLARLPPGRSAAEEIAHLSFLHEGGASSAVLVSLNTHQGSGHRIEIACEDGSALLWNQGPATLGGFRLELRRRGAVIEEFVPTWTPVAGQDDRVAEVAQLVRRFGDWIEGGQPQEPSLDRALRVEALLAGCRESAKLGRPATLPPI